MECLSLSIHTIVKRVCHRLSSTIYLVLFDSCFHKSIPSGPYLLWPISAEHKNNTSWHCPTLSPLRWPLAQTGCTRNVMFTHEYSWADAIYVDLTDGRSIINVGLLRRVFLIYCSCTQALLF